MPPQVLGAADDVPLASNAPVEVQMGRGPRGATRPPSPNVCTCASRA